MKQQSLQAFQNRNESIKNKSNQNSGSKSESKDVTSSKQSSSVQSEQSNNSQQQMLKNDSGNDSMQKEEEKKEDNVGEVNYTDQSTPRLELSQIKLESAQKEKESFLEDLKKNSFILSENST